MLSIRATMAIAQMNLNSSVRKPHSSNHALDLASYIINSQAQAGRPTTGLDLQKLLYFAQGWHLAEHGSSLFIEPFQAWKQGPVVPSVYSVFSALDNQAIPIDHRGIRSRDGQPEALSIPIIERVLHVYGVYSTSTLAVITQLPDGPWRQVWEAGKDANDEIPLEAIQRYFLKIKSQESESHGE